MDHIRPNRQSMTPDQAKASGLTHCMTFADGPWKGRGHYVKSCPPSFTLATTTDPHAITYTLQQSEGRSGLYAATKLPTLYFIVTHPNEGREAEFPAFAKRMEEAWDPLAPLLQEHPLPSPWYWGFRQDHVQSTPGGVRIRYLMCPMVYHCDNCQGTTQ